MGDKIALRAGQLAADTEFMTAKYTDVFTNASLGWPAGLSLNLPSGGPSPPLAAMGARFRADVTDNLTLLGAVFDGNAAGPGTNDPQLRNRYGVNFRVNDPPLILYEAQFQWNAKKGDPGLDGKLKLGGWRHFGSFSDLRFDTSGLSLADPASSGMAASFTGDQGLYAVFEQKLHRVGTDDDRGIGVFGRGSYSPPDRNLIDIYADGGLSSSASPTRGRMTSSALPPPMRMSRGELRRSIAIFKVYGARWPIRSSEALLTAVYQYEVRAGLTLQPNVQFIRHPGGGATNPLSNLPGRGLKNAGVFGLRTVLKF